MKRTSELEARGVGTTGVATASLGGTMELDPGLGRRDHCHFQAFPRVLNAGKEAHGLGNGSPRAADQQQRQSICGTCLALLQLED